VAAVEIHFGSYLLNTGDRKVSCDGCDRHIARTPKVPAKALSCKGKAKQSGNAANFVRLCISQKGYGGFFVPFA